MPPTDEKLDRAFAKPNEIKPYIAKWNTDGEAPQLLINGEYVTYNYMTVLKGGPNRTNAQKLIAFSNCAQIAAGWMQRTGYPG
ncbi:spermidine/putrescine-binding protein [Bradyrhizobium sp. GM0.4]